VTIVRSRHPFEGRALDVIARCERHGRLHLLLVLPNGTRSLIPGDWTNLPSKPQAITAPTSVQCPLLATCDYLLRTRAVVDALLQRTEAIAASSTTNQED